MNVKRFVSTDMRRAMRQVRSELGPDAVILDTEVFADGAAITAGLEDATTHERNPLPEATAAPIENKTTPLPESPASALATEHGASALSTVRQYRAAPGFEPAPEGAVYPRERVPGNAARPTSIPVAQTRPAPRPDTAPTSYVPPLGEAPFAADAIGGIREKTPPGPGAVQTPLGANPSSTHGAAYRTSASPSETSQPESKDAQPLDTGQAAAMEDMREELSRMRDLIETQVSVMGWTKWTNDDPLRAALLKRLASIGLGGDVAHQLTKAIAGTKDITRAWNDSLALLTRHLVTSDHAVLEHGATLTLLGATGVGKTTSAAKLAAQFALRHGSDQVALISTDSYRIGAHEHLMAYGRIIDCDVYAASDSDNLEDLLRVTRDKRLVLIDTTGNGHRDARRLRELGKATTPGRKLLNYLVLPANAQASFLCDSVRAYRKNNLHGCIVTKLDEAVMLGGVITALARYKLPLAYVTDGQRVPDNLHRADAKLLVDTAVKVLKQRTTTIDDELMAVHFGARVVRP